MPVQPVYSPQAPGLPLTVDPAWHLARRAALNATAELAQDIRTHGTRGWLSAQLRPHTVADDRCDAYLADHFPLLGLDAAQTTTAFRNRPWLAAEYVTRATVVRQTFSRRVLFESLVEFFGDLLYVPFSADKAFGFVMEYDRVVIRAHALSSFRSMLRAAVKHPAMLLFLDNEANTKETVNENLGRELLELHTVGVSDPATGRALYTQEDVRNSSLLLTGHTRRWPELTYRYRPLDHYVGPVTVMGFSHPNADPGQGPEALAAYADYLARHPATARRIATRLCVRFVSDDPPASLVDRLTATYLANDTAIAPVIRTLFTSSEFAASTGSKIRRPAEFTASALAASGVGLAIKVDTASWPRVALGAAMARLRDCGHVPRGWPVVDGYPDTAETWNSTQAVMARIRSAYSIAAQCDPEMPASRSWADRLGIVPGMTTDAASERIFVQLTGFVPDGTHRAVVSGLLANATATAPPAGSVVQADALEDRLREAVAIVLSSPYFALR